MVNFLPNVQEFYWKGTKSKEVRDVTKKQLRGSCWHNWGFPAYGRLPGSPVGRLGIQQGKVVVAPDLATMMGYLETGQVDLYFDSPYPALTVYEGIGAHPLLRRWKK